MKYLNCFGNSVKTVQFDNISDLEKFINENKSSKYSVVSSRASSWRGNCTFDEAVKQMVYGYDKYNHTLVDNLQDFTDSEVLDKGGLSMDIQGCAYDMGAVVQGVPECCIADSAIEEKKHVRVVASVGFASCVEEDSIRNRGVAIANLVGTLMMKGYIVDLDFLMCYDATHHDNGASAFFVRIPTGNFCASTIAFLTSPQFLRNICIGVCDFILKKDINGSAIGTKNDSMLKWCKENSLYFPDGYDENNHDEVNSLYATPEKSKEQILKIYNEWINKKGEKPN